MSPGLGRTLPPVSDLAGADREAHLGRVPGLGPDVEAFLRTVDRRLEPHLERSLARVRPVGRLRDGVEYQLGTGGKRIRAAVCATVCELFTGSWVEALPFAAAVEHLQNFTLIHDDIADGDPARRGREAVWRRYGLARAINIGDAFVPLACLAILDAPYPDGVRLRLMTLVAEMGLKVAEGQALDLDLRASRDPTVDEYLECTRHKTGAFLSMATVGGGLLGGACPEHLDHLDRFALTAGVAFQIKDDLLDVTGGKGRTLGSDVREGKRSILAVLAMRDGTAAERRRLVEILDKPRAAKTAADLSWVVRLYRRTRSTDAAARMANELIDEATEHLRPLPDSEGKRRLIHISRYLSRRTH